MKDIYDHQVPNEEIANFIMGGRAEFTIKNLINGNMFKYHVKKKVKKTEKDKNMPDLWYVYVMTSNKFVYAGYIQLKNSEMVYTKGKNGNYEGIDQCIRVLTWTFERSGKLDSRVGVFHHGRCACCGKPLTDEKSIVRGFGDVCWGRLHHN